MRGLEPKHYLLLSGFMAAIATELAGLQHGWHDALTPQFLSGILMQVSLMIGAMYTGAPGATGQKFALPKEENTIKDPSRVVPAILLAVVLASGGLLSFGCASAQVQPPDRSAAAVRAQQANQAIQRIGEFQQAVIDGQQLGKIKTEDARVIVTWTVATLKRLKDAPQGWAGVALGGWADVRGVLVRDPNLSIWVGVIDTLLKEGL